MLLVVLIVTALEWAKSGFKWARNSQIKVSSPDLIGKWADLGWGMDRVRRACLNRGTDLEWSTGRSCWKAWVTLKWRCTRVSTWVWCWVACLTNRVASLTPWVTCLGGRPGLGFTPRVMRLGGRSGLGLGLCLTGCWIIKKKISEI